MQDIFRSQSICMPFYFPCKKTTCFVQSYVWIFSLALYNYELDIYRPLQVGEGVGARAFRIMPAEL